jgi:hypothetical protein
LSIEKKSTESFTRKEESKSKTTQDSCLFAETETMLCPINCYLFAFEGSLLHGIYVKGREK